MINLVIHINIFVCRATAFSQHLEYNIVKYIFHGTIDNCGIWKRLYL